MAGIALRLPSRARALLCRHSLSPPYFFLIPPKSSYLPLLSALPVTITHCTSFPRHHAAYSESSPGFPDLLSSQIQKEKYSPIDVRIT